VALAPANDAPRLTGALAYARRLRYERLLPMPTSRSIKPHPTSVVPTAVLIDAPERVVIGAKLERAGFRVSFVASAEEARRAAEKNGATLCDSAALGDDLSRHSIEQLIRARLSLMLERLGVEQVADLHALVIREVERGLFSLVLERCNGNKGEAARQLGLHRNTLRQKLALLETSAGLERRAPAEGARARQGPRTSSASGTRSRPSRHLG
jgi:DNA-binding protein Fis